MQDPIITDLEDRFIEWCQKETTFPESYVRYFGEGTKSKGEFQNLKRAYKESFKVDNVFAIDLRMIDQEFAEIEYNCWRRKRVNNTSFEDYNKQMSNGIPNAILNEHFKNFLDSLKFIKMGNDEFILYIRKHKHGYKLSNDQLGKKIWEWIREKDLNATLIEPDQSCLWTKDGVNDLPKTAALFKFERAILPALYDYLDTL